MTLSRSVVLFEVESVNETKRRVRQNLLQDLTGCIERELVQA